jgi:undecaprenyl-diphosphatase
VIAVEELQPAVVAADSVTPPRRRARHSTVVRRLLPLFGALLAVHLLLPQVGQAGAAVTALGRARWGWLAATAGVSALTYLFAAVALMGAAGRRLPLGRTWAAQVASAFTNRLAPAGIGGMTTNVHYLEATGSSRPAAVAAVGLNSVAGFVVHLVGVIAIIPILGAGHTQLRLSGPDLPDNWPILVGVVASLTVAGMIRWAALLRRHVLPPIREATTTLAATVRDPRAGLALMAGSVGVTAGYALALVAATHAFGVGLPITAIIAVYLGGAAVAAVAPTPGGLGALEAALVAGLTAAGAASGPAIAGVLAYRLITFWLPVVPGFVAYRALRRRLHAGPPVQRAFRLRRHG